MGRTLLTVALVAMAPLAFAQESSTGEAQNDSRETPRRTIRVLQNPYDISSFYRSGGSSSQGWAGLASDPAYSIAGFYRSQADGASRSHGWSRFWTSGYGARRPALFPGYRRSIGQNGDLFLVVPFLAPVGPISSAFFEY